MGVLKANYIKFSNLSLAGKVLWLLILSVVIIYFIGSSKKGGDFASYLEAAEKMLHGVNIYDPPHIHLRYSYSPFWAMVLMPLALLPMPIGVFIWLVLNVFFLWRTIFLLRNYFDVKFSDAKDDLLLWFLIVLYMSRFIELNFHHAQMTIFLLWCILESIKLSDMGDNIRAGMLLGIGIIIKVMPIVMVPYFIYRKKFVAAFVSMGTVVVAFFLPMIYLGKEKFIETNKTWFQILRPDSSDFLLDNTGYFPHNLSAFLYRLLMKIDAPYMTNLISLDYDTATKYIWLIILLLMCLTIYFLSTFPFKKALSRKHTLYEVSYIALLMPLIFPHQMKYAFYFLLPSICCLLKLVIEGARNGQKNTRYVVTMGLIILSFVLCTMTTDLLLGMKYSIVTQYLKTITLGTLLLIPALMLNRKYFVN